MDWRKSAAKESLRGRTLGTNLLSSFFELFYSLLCFSSSRSRFKIRSESSAGSSSLTVGLDVMIFGSFDMPGTWVGAEGL
jgi:hypothetical protein